MTKQWAFHYFVDDLEYIEVLDYRIRCSGDEFIREIVEIKPAGDVAEQVQEILNELQ